MASKKPSARRRQQDAFEQALPGMDGLFARERERQAGLERNKEAARRNKACESKRRYVTHGEAQDAIASCAAHGRRGLSAYRCPYCKGWHLTSHPR